MIAGIDVTTGKIFWELTAIDPATGQKPASPLVGFLPPNENGSEGLGFVMYTVKASKEAQTGDVISARATIIFDVNPPIDTPEIFNTIDAGTPTSSIVAMPGESETTFVVSWSGNDDLGGSGIDSYDIYVSDNGGAYVLWLDDVTVTEAQYAGVGGHTYRFYSSAKDNAGNTEGRPVGGRCNHLRCNARRLGLPCPAA